MKLRKLAGCAAFLVVLFFCLTGAERALREKNPEMLTADYYKAASGKHDIIFLGPSTIMNGVYPLLLWKTEGFAAYNLGSGNQGPWWSYCVAEEVIRREHPKLIVFECVRARVGSVVDSTAFLHYVTDRMPVFAPERWELVARAVKAGDYDVDEAAGIAAPITEYHGRWEELSGADFAADEKCITFGAKVDARVMKKAPAPFTPYEGNPDAALPGASYEALRSLIELCQRTDTQLLFIAMPSLNPTKYVSEKVYHSKVDAVRGAEKLAASYGVPFLDLINDGSAFDLDLAADTVDGMHLNISGAEKFTRFIGRYIAEHFDVPVRSGDASYSAFYEERYAAFEALVESRRME